MNRRQFLGSSAAASGLALFGRGMAGSAKAASYSGIPYPRGRYGLRWDSTVKSIAGSNGDEWACCTMPDGDLLTSGADGTIFGRSQDYSCAFGIVHGKPWGTMRGTDVPSNIDLAGHGSNTGYKVSGLWYELSSGITYCFVRNYIVNGDYRHSRLASSADQGKTWTWATWYFAGTFGCPDFIQGMPDDGYAYIVSQDNNDAYKWAAGVVLARVPQSAEPNATAWQYWSRSGWTSDVTKRSHIFTDPNGTERISMSYNATINRYILVTPHSTGSGVHNSSLGVFDAPNPWGPWSTMYYFNQWSPGVRTYHQHFPPAFMSGKDLNCVFSGQPGLYKFCTRRAVIT